MEWVTPIIVAAIGAGGLVLTAWLGNRRQKSQTKIGGAIEDLHAEVRTNHGKRLGERVEMLGDSVELLIQNQRLVMDEQTRQRETQRATNVFMEAHAAEDSRQFGELARGQERLEKIGERLEANGKAPE